MRRRPAIASALGVLLLSLVWAAALPAAEMLCAAEVNSQIFVLLSDGRLMQLIHSPCGSPPMTGVVSTCPFTLSSADGPYEMIYDGACTTCFIFSRTGRCYVYNVPSVSWYDYGYLFGEPTPAQVTTWGRIKALKH